MRIYLNLSKSSQSAGGLKALKLAANGRYLMCKSLPYYFYLLHRSPFIPYYALYVDCPASTKDRSATTVFASS